MKRIMAVSLVLVAVSFCGCKFKGDILASFDGGTITRGEFYQWLEDHNITKDRVVDKKNKQRVRLRQIALEKIQAMEARKAGYEGKPEYKDRIALTEGSFLAAYYRQRLRDSGEFKQDAVKVSFIRIKVETMRNDKGISVKLPESEVNKNMKAKMDLAMSLISQHDGGASFEDLARKYSDDYSRKNGGDIGYIVPGMREPEFVNAAMALQKGQITRQPVVIGGSIYIIKVTDRKVLTADNIDDVIDDESKAGRLARRLKMNNLRDHELRLESEGDVVNNIEKANLSRKDDILFSIGNERFTVENLNAILAIVENNRKAGGMGGKPFDDKQKRALAEKLFKDKILERDARRNNVQNDEKYKRQWVAIQESTLAGMYRNDAVMVDVVVPEEMIRAEYNQMKARSNGARIESYAALRDQIKDRIIREKRFEKVRAWEKDLLDRYRFSINEKKLEGDDDDSKEKK